MKIKSIRLNYRNILILFIVSFTSVGVFASAEVNTSTGVTSFTVKSFSSSIFRLKKSEINHHSKEVVLSLSSGGKCPLTIDYEMTLSTTAKVSLPLVGKLTFASLNDTHDFTLTKSDGSSEKWKVKIAGFTPQLENWNLDLWKDDKTLQPVSSKKRPYWASVNNTFVKVTTRTAGTSGNAAKLTTKVVSGKMVSGALFLGWFNGSNILGTLTKPMKMLFQGIEFSASKKIIAFEVDVNYQPGGEENDTGALVFDLVKHDPSKGDFVYRGELWENRTPNSDNTGKAIAGAKIILGSKAAVQETIPVTVVKKGEWTKVRADLKYFVTNPLEYSHLAIICSSSSQGHKFIGEEGSTLILDNFRIIYEE